MRSLNNVEYKGIITLEDYIKAIPSTTGFTNILAEPVIDDTFFYDVNSKTIHIKSSATKRGFFNMFFEKVQVGDIVEVECDFYSVSGVLPKIGIDEVQSLILPNTSRSVTSKQCKNGQWETIKITSLVTKLTYNGDMKITFGLWTSDVGEFYMRNARAKVTSKLRNNTQISQTPQTIQIPQIKKYMIRKNVESWEIRNDTFLSDNATLTVKDTTTLLLKYDVAFDLPTTKKSPIVLVSGDFAYNSNKYRPVGGNSVSTQVEIKLLNSSDAVVELSSVENYTHFTVLAIG